MSEWTDELKAKVIEEYESREPTPDNTMDIITELAEEFEKTPNGIRMILSKAGVYVKKTPAKSSGGSKEKKPSTGGTRVSKEEAFGKLTAAIEAAGLEVDEDIVSKLTGKAAMYFAEVITKANGEG
jgi:hypothetical protein